MDQLPTETKISDLATVLEPLRPTVVVRRRVVVCEAPTPARPAVSAPVTPMHRTDDDEPPPSSVFLHPDYNNVAVDDEEDDDELDELDRDESDAAEPGPVSLPPPSLRTVVNVDEDATISSVAKRLGRVPSDVAAELLARGYYSVTPRARLSDELIAIVENVLHCRIVPSSRRSAKRGAVSKKKPTKKAAGPTTTAKRVAAKKRSTVKKRGTKSSRV